MISLGPIRPGLASRELFLLLKRELDGVWKQQNNKNCQISFFSKLFFFDKMNSPSHRAIVPGPSLLASRAVSRPPCVFSSTLAKSPRSILFVHFQSPSKAPQARLQSQNWNQQRAILRRNRPIPNWVSAIDLKCTSPQLKWRIITNLV